MMQDEGHTKDEVPSIGPYTNSYYVTVQYFYVIDIIYNFIYSYILYTHSCMIKYIKTMQ